MNAYLTKLMMYHEIHRMNREGYSISRISRTTLLNRRTVRSYLAMTEHDFDLFMEKQSERRKDLFAYEGFIKSKLEKYQDTSSAQMHNWLKEHFGDFPSTISGELIMAGKSYYYFIETLHWRKPGS